MPSFAIARDAVIFRQYYVTPLLLYFFAAYAKMFRFIDACCLMLSP